MRWASFAARRPAARCAAPGPAPGRRPTPRAPAGRVSAHARSPPAGRLRPAPRHNRAAARGGGRGPAGVALRLAIAKARPAGAGRRRAAMRAHAGLLVEAGPVGAGIALVGRHQVGAAVHAVAGNGVGQVQALDRLRGDLDRRGAAVGVVAAVLVAGVQAHTVPGVVLVPERAKMEVTLTVSTSIIAIALFSWSVT